MSIHSFSNDISFVKIISAKQIFYRQPVIYVYRLPINDSYNEEIEMDKIQVSGMSCQHCVGAVTEALESIEGLTEISVDLDAGEASFTHAGIDRELIRNAIRQIGFDPGE